MKIIIENKAYLKLKYFVNLIDSEISGMAKSQINKDNIIVSDFIIFNQEVTGSSTIIDESSMAKFLNELMKKNEDCSLWNIWWHSHANMGVFWSLTDNQTIEEHCSQSYLLSLVVNQKMEMKARLDLFPKDMSPFKQETTTTFDIDDIKYLEDKKILEKKQKLELIENQLHLEYEQKLKNIQEKIEKLTSKDEIKLKEYCKKEIDNKVKKKTYILPAYSWNKRDFDYLKGFNKKKKWNWFQKITFDDDLDSYQDRLDEDFFNINKEPIGFKE